MNFASSTSNAFPFISPMLSMCKSMHLETTKHDLQTYTLHEPLQGSNLIKWIVTKFELNQISCDIVWIKSNRLNIIQINIMIERVSLKLAL
jgi:hypothetical protein